MIDDNMEKCCGVSTDFTRILTDFFIIKIGEKSSTKIPFSKMYRLIRSATLIVLYTPIYLQFDDYSPYFFRHILTETCDVVMDIPIALDILV